MFDKRNKLSSEVDKEARSYFKEKVSDRNSKKRSYLKHPLMDYLV